MAYITCNEGPGTLLATLKEKMVLKQGYHLESGAFFDRKGNILVPLGHQNDVVPSFGKWHQNSAPKGTVLWTIF